MRANVTRAAEGLDRRSLTVAEILRMQDGGIISEAENLTNLDYDPGVKARLYAPHAVNELWVIGAASRIAYVHRKGGEVWGSIIERGPDEALTTDALSGLLARLGSI